MKVLMGNSELKKNLLREKKLFLNSLRNFMNVISWKIWEIAIGIIFQDSLAFNLAIRLLSFFKESIQDKTNLCFYQDTLFNTHLG